MMNRQGYILIVDDDEKWRKVLVETLLGGNYHVDSVSTTSEALDYLQKNLYHLAVVDLRMVAEDPENREGIDLLDKLEKRGLNEATKVIMLSGFGTREDMRTSFREYKVLDFLSKDDFDNEEFLHEVQQVFTEQVKINLALDIRWQHVRPEQVVLNLDLEGIRIKRGPLQSQLVTELEDLFCRLFHLAKSVLVRPLALGHSGTAVVRLQPFYSAAGAGYEVIVKFGDFRKIEQEFQNFTQYVQPFLGGGRNTTILAMRRTPNLAGITYSLLGTNTDQLVDFAEFYHCSTISQIEDALKMLFWKTCGGWYRSRGHLVMVDLTADYKRLFSYPLEKLEQVLSTELRKTVQDKHQLIFHHLLGNRVFTNPLQMINELSLVCPTYICITHGDLNPHNLLIDSAGNAWLIDFQGTGLGHILRDVATLDSAVRFQLLSADEATLEERLQMEEALCSIDNFSQVDQLARKFSTQNPALTKVYRTVVYLRTLAYKLVEQNAQADISEYYIALLYNALNTLRFSSLASEQHEHALLSASLLVDRLGLASK